MSEKQPVRQNYHLGQGINPLPNPFLAGEITAMQRANMELTVPEEPVVLQQRLSLRERFWKRVRGQ